MFRSPLSLHTRQGKSRAGRLIFPLLILAISIAACAIPTFNRATPAPGPVAPLTPAAPGQTQPGAQAQQPTQAPLPPQIVEVEPLPNSELPAGAQPVLYFNQPMDRASVEASLQSTIPGQLQWLDDATARFVPSQAPASGERLDVTIANTARAANGLALAQPVQISYQGAGPLLLAERLPAPDSADINPSSAVAVTFNRPVVALGADPQTLPAAFTLEPAANGRGEWLNTSTYIFYPQPALSGGTQYTVRVDPGLISVDGASFPAEDPSALSWSFTTAAPRLLTVTPSTEQPVPLDAQFVLTFNQPMDPDGVKENFSLLGPDGQPVAGEVTWNEAFTELSFQPKDLLQRNENYTLVLFAAARSQGGATIGNDFAALIATVPQFAITSTRPAAGQSLEMYEGYGTIQLDFSSPAAPGQNFQRLVTIDPPITGLTAYRSGDGYQVWVSGYFQPSTSYTLTAAPDIADRWGAALGMPYSFTFNSQPARPLLVIPVRQTGSQAIFVPQFEDSIPAYSVNITRLALSRGRLTLPDFIKAEQDWQGLQNWESGVNSSWVRLYYPDRNVTETIQIPLTQSGDLLDPGLYFLALNPTPALEEWTNASPTLLVVSPIQMTLKTSSRQAFVWAVQTTDDAPAPNKQISIYDHTARVIGTCTTDAQGICQAELPARDNLNNPLFAVIGQPGDPDFSLAASNWFQGISSWEFGLPFQMEDNTPAVYVYTDRPIYRPGQTVNFRAVVRGKDNGRYYNPDVAEINIDVVSPFDPLTYQTQVLTTLRLPLSVYGTASGVYTLPDDARVGSYTLKVKEAETESVSFEVAEYRKPEIDLKVKFDKADALIGEDVQAEVSANYFFGAPAGNLLVRWSLFRERGYPDIPGGLSTGPVDTNWFTPWNRIYGGQTYVMDGSTQTLPDGTAVITISGAELRERFGTDIDTIQDLTLEVTVEDESGLPVSARAAQRIHPASYTIGVRPESWSAQAGVEMTFYIRTVNWQGSPMADLPLNGRFRKITWVQQESADPSSPPDYEPEYADIGSTDFQTSPNGEARLSFVPPEPGTYILDVTGEGGALTQQIIWAGGAGAAFWPDVPNQRILLRADAEKYQPGQAARIFIPNPFPKGALALVTVERSKVMRSQVISITDSSYELELPLSAEDAPNVYVSVVLLGRTDKGRPDFRVGYQELAVDPAAELLQVEIGMNPSQAQPGGQATFSIYVKDAEGNPVQGEFSLALIDKAVLALADPNAPSITDAFYGRQMLGVQNSLSLVTYGGRDLYVPRGRGGGGGGDVVAPAPVRSKYEDTAFWSGTIETDVSGVAQVTVTLPDNLTTWRADVRGLSEDTRVGQAEIDLPISKPLLVRPAAPRFVVVGDHFELAAVVHNNTTGPLQASVGLEAAGFALDDPNQAVQAVDVPAGERVRVSWWGTVLDVPALDLVFSAEAGELKDAARPEGSPIPVRRYAAPQTFGTAGLLNDAGQRTELVSLPRSFTPTGGALTVEVSPSLTAVVLNGLEALDAFPRDFTEPILSRLLPNLATYQALGQFYPQDDTLRGKLQVTITDSVDRLVRLQNENGGWGWSSGAQSDEYISSYVLLGLYRAAQAGFFVDPQVLVKGQDYLAGALIEPTINTTDWQLNRHAFQLYVLALTGRTDLNLAPGGGFYERLSPWAQALMVLALDIQQPGDPASQTLLANLQASAIRSATGANWQDPSPSWHNWSTPNFTTAVVAAMLAQKDPTSPLLVDAVRYLVNNRRPTGAWNSSYETSWVLLALIETAKSSGDMQPNYSYSAALNGSPLMEGQVSDPVQAAKPVTSTVPVAGLKADSSNVLSLQRSEGTGSLFYRAYLQVGRPAEDAPAVQRGMTITRQYYRAGQDCRNQACQPLTEVDLADPEPLLVRLTLTVPDAMYYVVVEDALPAGAEVLNPRLKTSQQNVVPQEGQEQVPPYALDNPFSEGWGWWWFSDPQVYDDRIRWVVDYLPAGTYELTYRLTPFLAGEFRLIPAHTWQYYFPEVEGSSAGSILSIH